MENNEPVKNNLVSCDECAQMHERCEAAEKRALYLTADSENIRKFAAKEAQLQIQKNAIHIISAFLPLYEDLQRCFEASATIENDTLKAGFALINKSFSKILSDLGITLIADRGAFNPEIHESISQIPASPEYPDGSIVSVLRPGFKYQGKLIQPAQVIIASAE